MKNTLLKDTYNLSNFKDTANKAYSEEISKLMFQKDGQGRLIFYNPDIFTAFKTIENTDQVIMEEIKRAIGCGFGEGLNEILLLVAKDLPADPGEVTKQIFLGQIIKLKGKIYLDVEAEIYFKELGQHLNYKHRFCSEDCDSEVMLAKLITKVAKFVKKTK